MAKAVKRHSTVNQMNDDTDEVMCSCTEECDDDNECPCEGDCNKDCCCICNVDDYDAEKMPCNHPAWTHMSDQQDFDSALSFLSLVMSKKDAKDAVQALQERESKGKIDHFKPKDILRAAHLAPLSADNPDVAQHIKMIKDGQKMAPPLVIRGDNGKAIIACGYHRTSAAYIDNMGAPIPCVVIDA